MTKSYFKNIVFTIELLIISLVVLLVRTFFPDIMFPHISIPMMVLFVAIAEIIVYYTKVKDDGKWYFSAILGGIAFSVLPYAAGIAGDKSFVVLFIVGTVVYGIVDFLYLWMAKRMKGGASSITAPAVNGLILFLASQAFMGMI